MVGKKPTITKGETEGTVNVAAIEEIKTQSAEDWLIELDFILENETLDSAERAEIEGVKKTMELIYDKFPCNQAKRQ